MINYTEPIRWSVMIAFRQLKRSCKLQWLLLLSLSGLITSLILLKNVAVLAQPRMSQEPNENAKNQYPEPEFILRGHSGAVMCVAFSPDGKWLASASTDNTVRLWDSADGKELHVFRGYQYLALTVAFSPDGKTLASGGMNLEKAGKSLSHKGCFS